MTTLTIHNQTGCDDSSALYLIQQIAWHHYPRYPKKFVTPYRETVTIRRTGNTTKFTIKPAKTK